MSSFKEYPKAVLKETFVLAELDDGDDVMRRSVLNAGDEVYLLGVAYYQDSVNSLKGNVYVVYSEKHREATTLHERNFENVPTPCP